MRLLYLSLLTALMLLGCTPTQWLTGVYKQEAELTAVLAWKKTMDTGYKPNAATMQAFSAVDSFETRVFLSSWCHDSRREVPRFLALLGRLPTQVTEYVLLDTTRTLPEGYKAQYNLTVTPTFVFYRKGRELGRILEKPTGRLEEHILRIVQ